MVLLGAPWHLAESGNLERSHSKCGADEPDLFSHNPHPM